MTLRTTVWCPEIENYYEVNKNPFEFVYFYWWFITYEQNENALAQKVLVTAINKIECDLIYFTWRMRNQENLARVIQFNLVYKNVKNNISIIEY